MLNKNNSIDFSEINSRFSSDEQCLDYLYQLRWENGFICPICNCGEYWEVSPYKYKCRNCKRQTSVTAGTFFNKKHLPMLQWFKAIFYMSIRREKATAVELKELLNLGSNKTAQNLVNSIKPQMYYNPFEDAEIKLNGLVEVGIEYIQFSKEVSSLYVAVETNNNKTGLVMIEPCPSSKDFIKSHISNGATISRANNKKSRSYVGKVVDNFEKWYKNSLLKDNVSFDEMINFYCNAVYMYKKPVTFDEILKNMVSGNGFYILYDKDFL